MTLKPINYHRDYIITVDLRISNAGSLVFYRVLFLHFTEDAKNNCTSGFIRRLRYSSAISKQLKNIAKFRV